MAKLTIKSNETSALVAKKKTVRGLRIRVIGIHGTANTAVANTDFDLSKVRLKVTLNRQGTPEQILNERMDVLAQESMFESAKFDYVQNSGTTHTKLVVAAGGVFETVMIPLTVDFGGPLNLRADDELEVETFCQTGTFGTNLNQSTSLVEIDWLETTGVENFVPYIQTKWIKASETDVAEDLGDNIMAITFLNLDKTSEAEASRVANSVTLSSDRQNYTSDYRDMLDRRRDDFVSVALAATRYQSFRLLEGEEYDNVNLKLTLDSSNVNANKNVLVIRRFKTDAATLALAEHTREAHLAKRMRKFGLGGDDKHAQSQRSEIIRKYRTR